MLIRNINDQVMTLVKCETSLSFCENKGWINSMDPYGWFQWCFRYCLSIRSLDDKIKIARWNGIVSRFTSKLVRVIEDINCRFDDYSISPKLDKFYCIRAMN